MRVAGIIFFIVLLSACERDEIPVEYMPPVLQQGTFITQIQMGSDYRYRSYYDLETNSVIAVHEKGDWDLAFASGQMDHTIRLNSSKLMAVWKVDGVPFEAIDALQGAGPSYDGADGTQSALDDWHLGAGIYIIDRGIDAAGISQGRVKIELQAMDEQQFVLRYARLDGSGETTVSVPKDDTRSFVQLSFESGVRFLEPAKEDWDLLFTHYTLFFEDLFGQQNVYYLVAGVLLNPYQVEAQDLPITDFEAIDSEYLQGLEYSTAQDVIGYDWKEFELAGETYSIVDNAFAIRTVDGNTYKLQFTSFLDENGERGAPTFQAALIQ